jgi:hypothetical protein
MKQLRASQIAAEYGFTGRHWIRQASEGKIPGARQPSGPGGQWLFDAKLFAAWWESRKREVVAWPGFSGEEKRGGRVHNVPAINTETACRQRTEQLLRSVLGHGSTASKPSSGGTSLTDHGRKQKRSSSGNISRH